MKIFTENHVTYPRIMEDRTIAKLIDFDYLSLSMPELSDSIKEGIVHQYSPLMDKMSIDKLSFRIHRDFLKENKKIDPLGIISKEKDSYRKRYLNDAVTIDILGEWVWIHLHREYIPLDKPLSDYVEQVFRYLIFCTSLFKVPLHKTAYDILRGGEVKEKDFTQYKAIVSEEEYFQAIYSQITLTCIELCFDFHGIRMSSYLPKNFSIKVKGSTYYLSDYREYKNGSIHRSMFTLYNKAKEQRDRKNRLVYGIWERFEIRLFPYSFSCMKRDRGFWLLNNTYDGLLKVLSKYIKSHIKKYELDFQEFIEHLPDGYEKLKELLCLDSNK